MLRTYHRTGLLVRSVVKMVPNISTEQVDLKYQRLECFEHITEQVDLQDQTLKCYEFTTEQVYL